MGSRPLWPQLQTSELLSDLQLLACEDGAPSGAPTGTTGDSPLELQHQQLRLIQILDAAKEGNDSAPVAAAAALFQCERKRQQLLQQVLSSCLQCELLRLAFLSAFSSIAPKRQQQLWSTAFGEQQGQQQELERALGCSICLGAVGAVAPLQLPSAAQTLESYWERLRGVPVVFEGAGPCELDPLDIKQTEKDVTRETFTINNQILKGADGLLQLLSTLCTRLREAEISAAEEGAATEIETRAREKEAPPADSQFSFSDLPETVAALISLGLLPSDLCGTDGSCKAAGATAEHAAIWAAAARVFCAIRLLSLSSRTHGGGAAFAAALRVFACPALPLLLQPDNQVSATEQQQYQRQQKQNTFRYEANNVTEIVTSCCTSQKEGSHGPLMAILHTTTPFKLLLPEHEHQTSCSDGIPQQQRHQQHQQELLRRLGSVTVDAHFFATLRSVSLQKPSAELHQFDNDMAGQVRRRESAAALISAILAREIRQTCEIGKDHHRLLWLPAQESQQWVLARSTIGVEEEMQVCGKCSD